MKGKEMSQRLQLKWLRKTTINIQEHKQCLRFLSVRDILYKLFHVYALSENIALKCLAYEAKQNVTWVFYPDSVSIKACDLVYCELVK